MFIQSISYAEKEMVLYLQMRNFYIRINPESFVGKILSWESSTEDSCSCVIILISVYTNKNTILFISNKQYYSIPMNDITYHNE